MPAAVEYTLPVEVTHALAGPVIAGTGNTFTVIFTEIWIFRWVINRMPVLKDSPEWVKEEK